MTDDRALREARDGVGPRVPPTPLASTAEMADLVRQVRIDHSLHLEDDDQGPFLHFSDASGVALACWPRIAAAVAAARAQGAAEAYERAAKVCDECPDQPDGYEARRSDCAATIRALASEAAK